MIQDQLLDYIASQMKLGVSRDAIKSALTGAGWLPADVEDTLCKIEGSAVNSSPQSKPASMASSQSSPQMIRVSDLVSADTSSAPVTMSGSAKQASVTKSPAAMPATSFGGKVVGNTFEATSVGAASGRKFSLKDGIGAILILGFAGAAGYFYYQASGLHAQITSLNTTAASVSAQLTSLQSQFEASSTGLTAQIASLSAADQRLALELSFYVASSPAMTTSTKITIAGTLVSGNPRTAYALVTPDNAKLFIQNPSDQKLAGILKSLIGSGITISGTYVPGTQMMTAQSIATGTTPSVQ